MNVLWKAVPGSATCIREGPLAELGTCTRHDIVRSGRWSKTAASSCCSHSLCGFWDIRLRSFVMPPPVDKGQSALLLSILWIIGESKGLTCPNFDGRFPTLDATRISVSMSKGQKVRVTRPINSDTHRAPYLPNGKAYELRTRYTDGTGRPTSAQAPWPPRSKVKVERSRDQSEPCWPNAHKSKTNSRSISKIGRMVSHDTCYIAHQFRGQKVKGQVTGRLRQTHKMCHIFRMVRPKNSKFGVRMEDVDSH